MVKMRAQYKLSFPFWFMQTVFSSTEQDFPVKSRTFTFYLRFIVALKLHVKLNRALVALH